MKTFNSDECSKKYSRKEKLLQHMEKDHNTKLEKKRQAMNVVFVATNSQRADK